MRASIFAECLILGLVISGLLAGCATTGGEGPGAGDQNQNTNQNGGGDTGGDGASASPGFAAFTAGGCAACHPSQATDFSASSVDDIVDTLLGEKEHPGGDFGDLSEGEVDDLTDFLLAVMLGDESLSGPNDGDGIDTNGDAGDGTGTAAYAWFTQVWTDFDENYSHFAAKGVDWDAVRSEYEPRFRAELDADAFVTELAAMLAELRDLHVWLFDAAGAAVEVYARPATPNYPNFYPAGVVQWGSFPLWHGWIEQDIAFLSIETFDGAQWDGLRTGDVEALFATYAGAAAMVLDIRFNNGGDETIAQTFAAHLTGEAYSYGYHRDKQTGADHDDFGPFVAHQIEPAAGTRFLGPVACLIGQRNMSSAEWFVLMMRENPNGITLVGDTTRGSSGSPREFSLDNGVKYYIPSWEAFRADQVTPIEDVGVPPSAGFAILPEESFSADRDYVIERAVDALRP